MQRGGGRSPRARLVAHSGKEGLTAIRPDEKKHRIRRITSVAFPKGRPADRFRTEDPSMKRIPCYRTLRIHRRDVRVTDWQLEVYAEVLRSLTSNALDFTPANRPGQPRRGWRNSPR